jgi:serine/threonine protein kinase
VPDSSDDRVGTTLRTYRIDAILGRGGQGVVYLAEQAGLDRKVALKVLSPELAHDETFRWA